MAITYSQLTVGSDSTTQTTYTTASVAPAATGEPVLLWVANTKNVSTTFPVVSSVTGCSLTWTVQAFTRITFTTSGLSAGVNLCIGKGTATTGTIAITNNNGTSTGTQWAVVQATGADPTTPIAGSNFIGSTVLSNQTSTSLTLPATPAAGNAIFGAVYHEVQEDIVAGTNFSVSGFTRTNMAAPTASFMGEAATGTLTTTCAASWATSSGYFAAFVEIAAAASGSPVGFIPI